MPGGKGTVAVLEKDVEMSCSLGFENSQEPGHR